MGVGGWGGCEFVLRAKREDKMMFERLLQVETCKYT